MPRSSWTCEWGWRIHRQPSGESVGGRGRDVKAFVRYTSRGSWGHLEQVAPAIKCAAAMLFFTWLN